MEIISINAWPVLTKKKKKSKVLVNSVSLLESWVQNGFCLCINNEREQGITGSRREETHDRNPSAALLCSTAVTFTTLKSRSAS